MEKSIYRKEKEIKEKAIKYFKEFFEENGSIKKNVTTDDLYKKYLYYCEKYFTKNDIDSNKIKMDIKEGYEYVFYIIEGTLNYTDSKKTTAKLLDSYNGLVRRIGEYRFKKTKEGSYGENQNNANDNILVNISNLKQVVYRTINNINVMLKNYNKDNLNIFSIETLRTLNELRDRLISQSIELDEARNNYYKALNDKYLSNETSFTEVGNAKKAWRQKKNEACAELLNFVKVLYSTNKSIAEYYSSLKEEKENIDINSWKAVSELYFESMREIRNSKEYYSFLSETEKEKLSKDKKIKKLKK